MRISVIGAVIAVSFGMASTVLAEEAPAPTPSSDPTVNTAQQPVVPDPEGDKVVCRKEEAATGTRIGSRKICKTQREWDQIERESQQAVQRAQDAGLRNNPSSGAGN